MSLSKNFFSRHLSPDKTRKSHLDFPKDFKDEVKKQIKRQGTKEDLLELVEGIRDDMRENYNQMIAGYLKFWKPSRMVWINPVKKSVHFGGVKIILNPELGVRWQGKDIMIKLYLKANENLDKRHADIILAMMESELRDKVNENVEFAILDVRRGKLFTYVNDDPRLLILLKLEGREFSDMWWEL